MRSTALHVRPVRGRTDESAFIVLPYALYRGDPQWVPPLRGAERRRWSPARNATLRAREAARFLARRGSCVVGRIAAGLDREFAARWAPSTGFFGFFECADDDEASAALFEAAHAWLRDRGALRVLGPVNLSTHDEVGLLVDGFDSRPMLLSPYNPPRYERHLRGGGYLPARHYYAYLWTPDASPSPAVGRLARAALRRAGGAAPIAIRPADPGRWDEELRTLFTLYNGAFDALWGFVPMTLEEFMARAEAFRPFYRPELALFAEADGRAVGFGLVLPDVNAALRPLGGRLFPFGWLHLWRALPRLREGRFLLAGVLPEYVGRGVAPLIAYEMASAARRLGMRRVELSLVHEANTSMRHVIEAFGCPRCKTYRLFERAL